MGSRSAIRARPPMPAKTCSGDWMGLVSSRDSSVAASRHSSLAAMGSSSGQLFRMSQWSTARRAKGGPVVRAQPLEGVGFGQTGVRDDLGAQFDRQVDGLVALGQLAVVQEDRMSWFPAACQQQLLGSRGHRSKRCKAFPVGRTRHPVQDFSQRGGDGQVEGAVFVARSIHGMLDHVAGGIDASFV
ncbi:hypothetical protein EYF80_048350 [Liparis tanakae]|uniref:Uncharacterized protein n=1 Tax=Liparis tanakae TaxID=230148 RepID=A0A4Z2FMH2_9TELE|nr:hypothetical protein EYF80_048350 [Liparis tanakae]